MRRIITRRKLIAAMLAVGALAASPAYAKPVDRIDRFETPTATVSSPGHPSQDLRGERARDAARMADQPSGGTVKPRVYWSYDYEAAAPHPAGPAPASPHRITPAAPDDGTPWAAIAAALAGLAVFSGGLYVMTRSPHTKAA